MSATWFDHAIATVAPRMAARRVMARQAFETLTRGYDGAARGRRTEGWRAPGSPAEAKSHGAITHSRINLHSVTPATLRASPLLRQTTATPDHHASPPTSRCAHQRTTTALVVGIELTDLLRLSTCKTMDMTRAE